MSVQTRSQKLAHKAYEQVSKNGGPTKDYVSFARRFPALLHTCGLAQAVAFAQAKGSSRESNGIEPELVYLDDLVKVLEACGHKEFNTPSDLEAAICTHPLSGYIRLSRDAIHAASWLKRYAEAIRERQPDAGKEKADA